MKLSRTDTQDIGGFHGDSRRPKIDTYRFGACQYPFSVIGDWSAFLRRRSGYCPAISPALVLLSSNALSSCVTVRLSARCGGSQSGSLLIEFISRRVNYGTLPCQQSSLKTVQSRK